MCNLNEKPEVNEFDTSDCQTTQPLTLTEKMRKHLETNGDGVPVVMMEDIPTQPIRFGTTFREPDFDEEILDGEITLIPTGDE